jgi:DNA-binding Lrp family transcriptional regulator
LPTPLDPAAPARPWSFLTSHALVLLSVAADPRARMRDVAARVGITERAVQRVVAELAEAGYVTIRRVGRRNQYVINARQPLRHPLAANRTVRHLLALGRDRGQADQ